MFLSRSFWASRQSNTNLSNFIRGLAWQTLQRVSRQNAPSGQAYLNRKLYESMDTLHAIFVFVFDIYLYDHPAGDKEVVGWGLCVSVCLSVCISVCFSVCIFACISVCISYVSLYVSLYVFLHASLYVSLYVSLNV